MKHVIALLVLAVTLEAHAETPVEAFQTFSSTIDLGVNLSEYKAALITLKVRIDRLPDDGVNEHYRKILSVFVDSLSLWNAVNDCYSIKRAAKLNVRYPDTIKGMRTGGERFAAIALGGVFALGSIGGDDSGKLVPEEKISPYRDKYPGGWKAVWKPKSNGNYPLQREAGLVQRFSFLLIHAGQDEVKTLTLSSVTTASGQQ